MQTSGGGRRSRPKSVVLHTPLGTRPRDWLSELSDTEYAVLGLLTFGERSGYELDKLARRRIGYFWQPARSKIYAILPRLVERGLAVSSAVAQERRPHKQLYRLTQAGEASLREWLTSGRRVSRVTREGLLVKLFFGSLGGLEELREQVIRRKLESEEKLAELEEIERTIDRDEDFFPHRGCCTGSRSPAR
jgi:PadR family transcriptional regulator, regulatory protein AphA